MLATAVSQDRECQSASSRPTSAFHVLGSACAISLTSAGLLAIAGLALLGAFSLFNPSPAAVLASDVQPSGGGCECDHSNGAVCCCCSHCGCAGRRTLLATTSSASAKSVGNHSDSSMWDIDVGGLGTAGGGSCLCNGVCCCCSSCDCTGPGTSFSNVTFNGDCNGASNCNGDLPARRHLSDLLRGTTAARLAAAA